jgi:hypothetical protein
MKNYSAFSTAILFLFITATSCEKVIELDLNEAEKKIVVEAILKDNPGDNKILLSYTSAVYTDQLQFQYQIRMETFILFQKIQSFQVIITTQVL